MAAASSPCNLGLFLPYRRAMIASAAVVVATTVYLTTFYYSAPDGGSGGGGGGSWALLETLRESYCVGQWAPRRPFWHEMDGRPLPACTMASCFDASRCSKRGGGSDDGPKIFVYKDEGWARPPLYMRALAGSPRLTDDPAAACLFLVLEPLEFYGLAHPRPSFGSLPHWDGGRNHVIVSLADNWPADIVAEPGSIGMAALATSFLQRASFRAGFDVGIPLPGLAHFRGLAATPPRARKYLLTFRGTRYVGNKEGNFRSSAAFRGLHNGADVVVAVSCAHRTNDRIRARCPRLGAGCDADEAAFRASAYADLMNATFGLAPAGRSSSSYRIVEVISAGAIPVIVADYYVDPLEVVVGGGGHLMIEWRRCALTFGTHELPAIVPALRAMPPAEMEARQAYCLRVYDEYLKDDATLVASVINALFLRLNASTSATTYAASPPPP